MKFYDTETAPSPRRVRIYMSEKGIEIPKVPVDMAQREQLSPEFLILNPWATVPVLVLDDGTAISEVSAVIRYLEEIHPDPPLLGRDAREKAIIQMWEHRIELDGLGAIAESFRNRSKGFQERALTGSLNLEQIPELIERGKIRLAHFFQALEAQLVENEFIAGNQYSVADITAMVCVDFARAVKMGLEEEHPNARRWYGAVSQRPSAKA